MSRLKRFSRELWVGILGIIALFTIYFLINFFKGVDVFDDTDKYTVEFANIGEITNSAPVFVNGCKIGNVSNIEHNFNQSRLIYVTLSIEKGLRIPSDSYAEIHNKMLGGSTINLMLGYDKGTITPGDTIRGVLDAGAMGKAGDMLAQIEELLPKADSILTSLNSIVSDPAISSTLKNVESTTAQLRAASVHLNSLARNDVPQVAGKFLEVGDTLLSLSTKLNNIDYKEIEGSLKQSLNNIEQISTTLNEGQGTLGMLLKDPVLYNKLYKTCDAAISLLEDLKEKPKRYVHFSVFGKKEKSLEEEIAKEEEKKAKKEEKAKKKAQKRDKK